MIKVTEAAVQAFQAIAAKTAHPDRQLFRIIMDGFG